MDIAGAIAASGDQPQQTYAAMEELAASCIGARLFTLLTVDTARGEGERIYSNMPDIYPVAGRKPIPVGKWSNAVIQNHEVFIANSIGEIAEVFPDHELIAQTGCGSVINIPVVVAGSINCLDRPGHYTPERAARAQELRLPGIACFLLGMISSQPERP